MFPYLFTKESVESFKCDICQFSKHDRATFSPKPSNNSISGAKWFVSLIDDSTYATWIFLMKHKYEVCQIFVDFLHLVKNQFDKYIKRLQSDNGTEFFLKDNGVVHELTCVNTSQQNVYLLEVARALLFQMSIPNVYWGEAAITATYLINRLPTHVLNGISLIKHILSFFPSSPLMLSLLSRVFGCVAFVHSHNPHRGKLDPRAVNVFSLVIPQIKRGLSVIIIRVIGMSSIQVQEVTKPTLVPKQVQLSKLEVSILENPIKESFIVAIDVIKIPTLVLEALKDEN
ncbi:hypothetical protein CR513_32563, partial [Mucuna pruriens]